MANRRLISTTPHDAAEKLGKHFTTIYRRCENKQMAALKDGRAWRIFLIEVDQGGETMYFPLPYSALEKILGEEIAEIVEEV